MAGPAATVVAPIPAAQLSFQNAFDSITSGWLDSNFCWISNTTAIGGKYCGEGRPFVGRVCDLCEPNQFPEFTQGHLDAIQIHFGVVCKSSIVVAAMCNQQCDHQVLAEVVASVAQEYKGIVSFGGQIPCEAGGPASLKRIQWSEDGEEAFDCCGTPDAVRWWLQQPDFHMIK